MKKSVIQKQQRQIDVAANFTHLHRTLFAGDYLLLCDATRQISRPTVLSGLLRGRLFQQQDIEAVFECIAAAGEAAFREPWVVESIHWWHEILHRRVDHQWPPREFSSDQPRRVVCAEREDGTVVLPDVGARRKRTVRPRSIPITLTFMPSYYWWDPIPRREYKKFQAGAKRNLERIGRALAFIGGGAEKKLTAEEVKPKIRVSNRDAQQTGRARRYYQQAWESYQAKTKGITDPERIYTIAQRIANQEFSRKTSAKNLAERMYWEDVNRDPRLTQTVRNNSAKITY